jgi:hypothetical protein
VVELYQSLIYIPPTGHKITVPSYFNWIIATTEAEA